MMNTQQENNPKPVVHPEEADTGEQPESKPAPAPETSETKSPADPPHVETPKVPDADAEGLP
ncbi:hypothetical protein [Pedobacter immunditicola]|uniref:hypothetical protein n=1 Tax=Pedobacter immunditicola TaxID=3133440 RepID=UPI00309D433F